ncbi:MAG: phospho-N-acetylmuramoyl-pentapeptide-transferase, partial [Proteobacteria bacterium]|nr:phospho-N-acetylmuramoyl-pentapeptide-transferase [Pseudomonadota bacterium]
MLYHLLYSFRESFHALQVFRYITFRSLGAGLTSLLICLALGPRFIAMLKGKQY